MLIFKTREEAQSIHDSFGACVQYQNIKINGVTVMCFSGYGSNNNPYCKPDLFVNQDLIMAALNKTLGEK